MRPVNLRRHHHRIPDLLRKLETDAPALRVRQEALSQGIVQAEPVRGDMEGGARQAETVAALTADLERAIAIGREIDAELSGRGPLTETLH